jgi:hypothetical protein
LPGLIDTTGNGSSDRRLTATAGARSGFVSRRLVAAAADFGGVGGVGIGAADGWAAGLEDRRHRMA